MSCIKCKSSPCACNDHGLVTPCVYDDCNSNSEPCEEIVCEECVRNCGDQDFRIDRVVAGAPVAGFLSPGKLLTVMNNEPLAMTLQKIYLYMEDPTDAQEDNENGHGIYYVYLTNITNTTITVNFTGWSALAEDFQINISTDDGLTYSAVGPPIAAVTASPTVSYVVGSLVPLIPVTDYVIKVTSRFVAPIPIPSDKDSVKVHTKTLPL